MSALRLVLPLALLAYFLWRSRRQRLFLLGVPFLMDMYYSIFFEHLKGFWAPHAWLPADHMMFWLVLTWIVYFDFLLPARKRTYKDFAVFGPRLTWPEEVLLVVLGGYMLVRLGATAIQYGDLSSAIGEARVSLYVFAGYFLLRGMFTHASREETLQFIEALVVVNTIAAGLYVLHEGLHVTVYVGVIEYQKVVFNGQVLTRSFYFMPQYLPLAVAYCAARPRWNLFWLGVLVVTLAAVWVSYTRALVLISVAEIALILLFRMLKRGEAWPAVKRAVAVLFLLVVFVVAAFVFLPTQSSYLFTRLADTTAGGSATKDTNLQTRYKEWRITYSYVGAPNALLGAGFPSAAQSEYVGPVGKMAPDLVWIPMLWNLGILGIVILAAIFFAYIWRAAGMSLRTRGDPAVLSLVLLGVIFATFFQGFVEWTIFDPWHTPCALWFFAILAAEYCRQSAEVRERDTTAASTSAPPVTAGGAA